MRARNVAALAAGSLVAVVGLVASVGWDSAQVWSTTHPVEAAEIDDDGAATVGAFTLRFEGVEQLSGLESSYGDTFDPPDGWVLWRARFEVSGGGEDEESFGTVTHVDASDGATYTRSDLIGFLVAPDQGWLGEYYLESGTFYDVVLLPDGVTPERLRIVPSLNPRTYWSFEV